MRAGDPSFNLGSSPAVADAIPAVADGSSDGARLVCDIAGKWGQFGMGRVGERAATMREGPCYSSTFRGPKIAPHRKEKKLGTYRIWKFLF